jgi:hypothetical protein
MASSWVRTVNAGLPWTSGSWLIASLQPGSTLIRVRFGWGFFGTTDSTVALNNIASNIQILGLVTTVGNGSETPPNARTQAGDADPPQERWLWWEGRQPVPSGSSDGGSTVTWEPSPAQEIVDAKGMVAAATIPSGQTLNLWASWAAAAAWDGSGQAFVWAAASVLIRPTPV